MKIYHYYDKKVGPLKNISDLTDEEASHVLEQIRHDKPNTMRAKRQDTYVQDRRRFEAILLDEFKKKGGIATRKAPHYFVLGECPWLEQWFEDCEHIEIDLKSLDLRSVSFTYGDSHPTFSDRVNDGKEYRKKLYMYPEILEIIKKYGYPQEWNADGKYGPERYIEVHVWTDEGITKG